MKKETKIMKNNWKYIEEQLDLLEDDHLGLVKRAIKSRVEVIIREAVNNPPTKSFISDTKKIVFNKSLTK